MKGSPLLRASVLLATLLLLAWPLRRVTLDTSPEGPGVQAGKEAQPAEAPSVTPQKLGLMLSFTRGAERVELRHLGALVWEKDRPALRESVELNLGKGIGASDIKRVLSAEYEEELVEWTGNVVHRDLLLGHTFKKSGLNFRTCSVDLIRKHDVSEYRAVHEIKLPGFRIEDVYTEHIAREHIWCELNSTESERHRFSNFANQQRLGQARNPHKQCVAASKQANRQLLDRIFLSNNHTT